MLGRYDPIDELASSKLIAVRRLASHVYKPPLLRILDASLNRAAEGLRVVEDYVRFVLDDPFLTRETKALRHDLAAAAAAISAADRHAARDTLRDVGTAISTPSRSATRADAWDVCAASLKRAEQSLRSLEEYGKAGRRRIRRPSGIAPLPALHAGKGDRRRSVEPRATGRCAAVRAGRWRQSPAEFERLVEALVEAASA